MYLSQLKDKFRNLSQPWRELTRRYRGPSAGYSDIGDLTASNDAPLQVPNLPEPYEPVMQDFSVQYELPEFQSVSPVATSGLELRLEPPEPIAVDAPPARSDAVEIQQAIEHQKREEEMPDLFPPLF